jgi:hypothetical protein
MLVRGNLEPIEENTMSAIKAGLLAAALGLAFVTPSFAEEFPWDMRNGMAYMIDMQGKMKMATISDKGTAMAMRRAKPVSRGTVFFMSNGQLYMTKNSGLFDRVGAWMGAGGF